MPVARLILLGFALAALAACASRPEPASNPYGLNAELRGAPPVRTWTEPAFEQTATLSSNDAYTLYNPAELYIPDGKRLYVWDGGGNRLKLFTPNGEYVRAYGSGPGDGPGEIQVYKNVGRWRDSLYVLDPQNRRLSSFSESGTFGSSEQYRRNVSNVALSGWKMASGEVGKGLGAWGMGDFFISRLAHFPTSLHSSSVQTLIRLPGCTVYGVAQQVACGLFAIRNSLSVV